MSSKRPHPTGSTGPERPEEHSAEARGMDHGSAPQAESETEARSMLEEKAAALEKELANSQAQAAEYKDGWQRSVAEFQNYKRRVESEKAETYQSAVGAIVKRYLPILDDLEKAVDSRPADLAWAEGIDLIRRKLQAILEAEGVKRMEPEGQPFDPNFHEAISQEPAKGVESGTVLSVVRNGYMLGERVIRPAMVRVAQ